MAVEDRGKLLVKLPLFSNGYWTLREFGIWLSSLIITAILGVLLFVDVVDSWVAVFPGAMGVIMALWRFGVKAERKKQPSESESK